MSYALGKKWEMRVSEWLQKSGSFVLEAYLATEDAPKELNAPVLKNIPSESFLAVPDLLEAAKGVSRWVEVKYKTKGMESVKNADDCYSGFEYYKFVHYQKVQEITGIKVVIFFIHGQNKEVRCVELDRLIANEIPKIYLKGKKIILWDYNQFTFVTRLEKNDGRETRIL